MGLQCFTLEVEFLGFLFSAEIWNIDPSDKQHRYIMDTNLEKSFCIMTIIFFMWFNQRIKRAYKGQSSYGIHICSYSSVNMYVPTDSLWLLQQLKLQSKILQQLELQSKIHQQISICFLSITIFYYISYLIAAIYTLCIKKALSKCREQTLY